MLVFSGTLIRNTRQTSFVLVLLAEEQSLEK